MTTIHDTAARLASFAAIDRPALSSRSYSAMAWAGLAFLLGGVAAFGVATFMLWRLGPVKAVSPPGGSPEPGLYQLWLVAILNEYAAILLAPGLVVVIGFACLGIGALLLRAAGASGKEVIPREDFAILSQLLLQGNQVGIGEYIRLRSLVGLTGFFTRMGLSGLPLAMLAVSVVFTILSLWNPALLELAKLTVGAFIGSYVSKPSPEQK